MAKGNIVRWITIKGRRIPIYEDGSMGGFMEGKQHQEKSEGRKTYRVYYEDGNQKLLEADSKEELDAYLKEHEKENGKVSRTETADEYDDKDTLKKSDFTEGKKVEVDQDELMEVVDKYNTSTPVSGNWDTETEHEQKTIADYFGISMDEAKEVMKEQLGFDDDMFPAKGQEGGLTDKEMRDKGYVIDTPITEEQAKRAVERGKKRELADEADAYDREHKEGKYSTTPSVDHDKVMDIAERYTTSTPVSGNWDTEGGHLSEALSKELAISRKQAEDIMVNDLGWDREDIKYPTSKETAEDNKGKSIKIGDKEVKVKKDKSMDDIFENRTTTRGTTPGMINTMSNTALRTQLRKAGLSSADMKGKDTEELRKMLLAIYKKR